MSPALNPSRFHGRRVLVTGASGFIGSHVARAMARQGAEVAGLARTRGRLEGTAGDIRYCPCDLRDAKHTLSTVLEVKPHIVFHLAAHPDAREDAAQVHACIDHNITGTANLFEALRELPGAVVVFGDSAKVFGHSAVPHASSRPPDPLSSYAVSKVAGWALCEMYRRVHGLQVVGIRPTLVYGPGQGFNLFSFLCEKVWSDSREIPLDGGLQTRDPLYVDDAVEAFVAAAERCQELDGRIVPIGGGREMTVEALATLTVKLLGGPQVVVPRPTSVRPTEMLRSWCDNAEAREALGWEPRTPLETGIEATAAFLAERRSRASASTET